MSYLIDTIGVTLTATIDITLHQNIVKFDIPHYYDVILHQLHELKLHWLYQLNTP